MFNLAVFSGFYVCDWVHGSALFKPAVVHGIGSLDCRAQLLIKAML